MILFITLLLNTSQASDKKDFVDYGLHTEAYLNTQFQLNTPAVQNTRNLINAFSSKVDPIYEYASQVSQRVDAINQNTQQVINNYQTQVEYTRTHNTLRETITSYPTPTLQELRKVDPQTIADLPSSQLPFQLRSNDASLWRLENDLAKIQPRFPTQIQAKQIGLDAVQFSDEAALSSETDDAEFYKGIAADMLDIAIGFHPVTGAAQSSYEFIRGKTVFGGHKIGTFQRGIAFAGILTYGAPRTGTKLAVLYTRLATRFHSVTEVRLAISKGFEFLQSKAGHLFSKMRGGSHVADDVSYQFYEVSAGKAFHYASDHTYARVIETKWAEGIAKGEAHMTLSEVAFVTPFEDIAGLKGSQIAEKLSLYADKEMTTLKKIDSTFSIVKFKVTPDKFIPLETSLKGEFNGFIPGGFTRGGARELIIEPDALSNLLKSGKISLQDIHIEKVLE